MEAQSEGLKWDTSGKVDCDFNTTVVVGEEYKHRKSYSCIFELSYMHTLIRDSQ